MPRTNLTGAHDDWETGVYNKVRELIQHRQLTVDQLFPELKEAFVRRYAGAGELWYSYFCSREEQREDTEPDWYALLAVLIDVLEGKPDEGADGKPVIL